MNDPASRTSVRAGDVLAGKYIVERVIGVGGMGVVVAAMHATLHQKVAVKLLLPAAAASEEAVPRFVREARAAAQLRSDHVARVLDVGTLEGGAPYMVMELLEGSDLEEVLRQNSVLPIHEAIDYVRQACDALAEAHERGIVHRDLKPGNLFLATDARGRKQIKVLDFGISKATAPDGAHGNLALTKTSAVMGSPLYMSPEQMRATRNVDARTDIWSLGVTLYQLLTGRVPFYTESPMELGAKVLHEEPTPPDALRADISPAVAAVVLRCLRKDPAARFASARELDAALERALAGLPPPSGEARVLVTSARMSGDGSSTLPYSHTALAHAGTENTTRSRSRARPLLFAGVALAAAVGVTMTLRLGTRDVAPPVGATDALRELAIDAALAAASSLPAPSASAPPPVISAIPAASAPPAPAPPSAPPRARPAPRRDRPRTQGTSSADVAAPPPPPSSNPLDHM